MKTKFFLNSLLAVVIGLIFYVPSTLAAFGISPPWVVNENLKPGSNFVYVIDMSTDKPYEDMIVKTVVTGDSEIAKWVTVRNQGKVIMPKGKKHVPLYIDIKVPEDAKVGKYKGDIGITIMPKVVDKGNISILLGGHIAVKLGVVNYDVTDFVVKALSAKPITEGQPLDLSIQLKNLGNVSVSEVKTSVEVKNFKTGDLIAKGSTNALSVPIYPHTVGDARLTVPIKDLKAGNYWVNASITKSGKNIYQNRLYLTVNESDINNVLKTSVEVAKKGGLKEAAEAKVKTTATTTVVPETIAKESYASNKLYGNNVSVQTTVTVKAPLTNRLIGVIIVLLGILIVITIKFNLHKKVRRRRK